MKKYQDHYFKKAKQENYPARSVYKLKEIDRQFRLFARGQRVLDLGACPGSWSLFIAEKVGPSGRVVGADLNRPEIGFPPQVTFIQGDVFDRPPDLEELLGEVGPFDGVVSDMAPKTTGIKMADQARSLDLVREAFEVARVWLRPGGFFVAKVFEGPDVHGFTAEIRPFFGKMRAFKPKSTRSESKETFLVGTGFKGSE
jgi:23S rRNA (uridine2552-2'-O)-methyltransferase